MERDTFEREANGGEQGKGSRRKKAEKAEGRRAESGGPGRWLVMLLPRFLIVIVIVIVESKTLSHKASLLLFGHCIVAVETSEKDQDRGGGLGTVEVEVYNTYNK